MSENESDKALTEAIRSSLHNPSFFLPLTETNMNTITLQALNLLFNLKHEGVDSHEALKQVQATFKHLSQADIDYIIMEYNNDITLAHARPKCYKNPSPKEVDNFNRALVTKAKRELSGKALELTLQALSTRSEAHIASAWEKLPFNDIANDIIEEWYQLAK